MKKVIYITLIILVIIVCCLLTYRFTIYNESYDTLKEAIEKTTNNGSPESQLVYNNGIFAYIKDSKKRSIGYYYKKDRKWYLDKYADMDTFVLNEKYQITNYYYKNIDTTFIEVKSLDQDISYISDSLDTDYKKMVSKDQEVYVGIQKGRIEKDYKIRINNKKYKVVTPKKEYRGDDYIYVEDE